MRRLFFLILALLVATPAFAQTIGTAVVTAQGAFTLQPTQTLTLSAQIVGCNSTIPTYQGNPISITPNQTPAAPFTANGSQQVIFTVPGNDQIICGGQNYSLYAITWKVNGWPIAPTQTYRFTDGQSISLSQQTSIGFVPASIANQYRSLCGAGQYLNGYDQNYNPQCYPIPSNTIINNIIQGGTGSVTGLDVVAAGADFTGTVDASSIFSASCAANPNGTLFLRQGTYLLAGSANLTLPTNCTAQFANGAQIKTGTQSSTVITSISRAMSANAATVATVNVVLSLTGLGATSSSTANAITINVPNTLPVGPITVQLSGTTNVTAGVYTAQSVNSSTIVLTCVTACSVKSLASEVGSLTFKPGSLTYVHLSTPLTGLTVPCLSSNNTLGFTCGSVIITGTTNYNGPFGIYNIPDANDLVLWDGRVGVPTETSGTISVPYTVTFSGAVQAATRQQLVVANSSAYFKGAEKIYPEWYGAKGAIASSNDWLPLQSALFWNPGQTIILQKYCPLTTKGLQAACTDYFSNDTLQTWGNHQTIQGAISNMLYNSVNISNQSRTQASGAYINIAPQEIGVTIQDLSFSDNFAKCWSAGNLTTYTQYAAANGFGPDDIMASGGSPRLVRIGGECSLRHGILLDGTSNAYNASVWGLGQPDYWQVESPFEDINNGYGLVAVGGDAQGGVLSGASNFNGNGYGGVLDNAENANLFMTANGAGNGAGALAAGTTQTITSDTVSGGVCTLVTTTALANNINVVNTWVTTTGTVSGGGTATDGTWQVLTVNNGTNTITFNCPGASGTATSGSVGTASSVQVRAVQELSPAGHGTQNMQVGGVMIGTQSLLINPYEEETNACDSGSSFQIGSENEGLLLACMASGAWSGVALEETTNQLQILAPNVLIGNGSSASMAFNLYNGYGTPSSPYGPNFAGTFTGIQWCVVVNRCDFLLNEAAGGTFELQSSTTDFGAGYNQILERWQSAGDLQINPLLTTGGVDIAFSGASGVGPVTFFESTSGGATFTIKQNGPAIAKLGMATGAASNTDYAGQLTLSGGTQTFTFTNTHASAPICVATDTTATNAVSVGVTTTVLTVNGTGTDHVNYVCIGRT